MANTTSKRGHRRSKGGRQMSMKITPKDEAIAQRCGSLTGGIETALALLEFVSDAAATGDERAIALLAAIGLEVENQELEPIIVRRSDGEVAAWIV